MGQRAVERATTEPGGRQVTLADLTPAARARILRFIIESAVRGGNPPAAIAALYHDLGDDPAARAYLDRRFQRRELPADWREWADEVADLVERVRARGEDPAEALRQYRNGQSGGTSGSPDAARLSTPLPPERVHDLLSALRRLAGPDRRQRSIFDDPSEEEEEEEARRRPLPDGQPPTLRDLAADSREIISRYAVEECFERGLPPIELLEIYRRLRLAGDERAVAYLDRFYQEGQRPPDWQALVAEAGELVALAERQGLDAGVEFARLRRDSPGLTTREALALLRQRLIRRRR